MSKRLFGITAASIAALSAGAALNTGAAFAQDAESDEIIITAERRAANIQDVPLAVSAFDPGTLEELNVTDSLSLAKFVPSMVGANNTGLGSANAYFLRGLGNTESIATFDPPVGAYIDDVYIARQNANNYQLFDVERIEVLRGPQGTLFGRNTTGGAINVILRKPSAEAGGYVEAGVGSYDRYMVRGSFDMPISDKVFTKLSGFKLEDSGYMQNIATNETLNSRDQYGGRLDVRVLFSDDLMWDVGYEYTSDAGVNMPNFDRTGGLTPYTAVTPVGSFPGQLTSTQPRFNVTRSGLREGNCEGSVFDDWLLRARGNCMVSQQASWTSNFEWQLGGATVNFISGYRRLEQNFAVDFFNSASSRGGFTIVNQGEHTQTSHELKITSDFFDGKLRTVGGFYFMDENNETNLTDGASAGALAFVISDRKMTNTTQTSALYWQGDFDLTDVDVITLGARYTIEEKELEYAQLNRIAPGSAVVGGTALTLTTNALIAANIPRRLESNRVTPRLAWRRTITSDINVFASVTSGFKSGGWNARSTLANEILPFGPERVWSYEAGLRSQFLDGALTFNATAYFMDVSALQLSSGFTRPDSSVAFLTQNVGDMEVRGLEFESRWRLTPDFSLFSNLSLMDAEYTASRDASQRVSTRDKPVRTPDISFNGGFSWDLPLGEFGVMKVSGVATYVGEYWVSTNNEQLVSKTGEYWLVNAGLGWEAPSGDWSINLDCSNCFAEEAVATWLFYTYPVEIDRWMLRVRYAY
jgi:iron complex outermembrane recepter protein